jgi:hypothetical protein
MNITNKIEFDNILRKLLKEWLLSRNFTGEFKVIYPKTQKGKLKIELYYDEFNPKELTELLSKKLCELKK